MSGERDRSGGDIAVLTHQRAEELISDQLDAPLDAQTLRTLRAHLAGCPSCAHFAAQMGVMGDGLRELPRLPASPTVTRQVRERIQQPTTLWDRLGRIFGGQLGLAPIAATAALLIAVVAGALLLDRDGNGTADNPTVLASTQISIDRTLTSTRATGEPTATREPGQILSTATLPPTLAPNITYLEPSASPTETPSPEATATAVPTDVPTEAPTDTAVPEPTETTEPEPTVEPTAPATDVPPTDTPTERSTDVPTDTPAPTSTEVPASTRTPTVEPVEQPIETATAEPTAEPTDASTETSEPDTATPEPETPEPGPPTIAPTDGTFAPIDDETPVEQPTDEPVDEPTETPVDDPDGEDTELTIEPVGTVIDGGDPIETPEGGTGGPIDESPTEETLVDETPDPDAETPVDPEGGDDEVPGAVLDETSRISTLPEGSGAPTGQLSFSPDESLMVISDASGSFLQIAEIGTGVIVQELGAGQAPVWSPLGGILLFNDLSDGSTVNAWFRDANDTFSISGSDVEDAGYADVPAGWFDSTAYYLRIYDDGTLSLRAYDANAGATIGEVWRSDGVELAGVRPLQTGGGFLIPTTDNWLLVTPDGDETALGGNTMGFVGDGVLSPDSSLLAISGSGGLYIVDAGDPGIVVAQIPYAGTVGAGFTWSPDGAYLAVSDDSSISLYTASGDPVGAATSETGVTIAGPQFQEDGIYFIQTSGEPSLRRFDLNRLLS